LFVLRRSISVLAGVAAVYDKTGTIRCFPVINGQRRAVGNKSLYPLIDKNIDFIISYNLIRSVFQLIQSQSQSGAASTKA